MKKTFDSFEYLLPTHKKVRNEIRFERITISASAIKFYKVISVLLITQYRVRPHQY